MREKTLLGVLWETTHKTPLGVLLIVGSEGGRTRVSDLSIALNCRNRALLSHENRSWSTGKPVLLPGWGELLDRNRSE